MIQISRWVRLRSAVPAAVLVCTALAGFAQDTSWPGYARDAQHTAVSSVAAQPLNRIHGSIPVDSSPPGGIITIHYGSPLLTAANTLIVPLKMGMSYGVQARAVKNGSVLWSQRSDYIAPFAGFIPPFSPALSQNRVIIPAEGGTLLVRENPDQATGKVTRVVFYGAKNFNANPQVYATNVQINTPITADSKGNVYFGFIVLGPTPIGLKSGLARVSATGQGTAVSAADAASDPNINGFNTGSAPALSQDEGTLYAGVNSTDFGYGYLLALNSQTLKTASSVRLKDPSSGLDAAISDSSTASPTVGPDGEVYFGVLENPFPDHNDRGWLLHFNSDLSQTKIPGSFGWDDTVSIVDASLVASYKGTSTYLLMTKYNNYIDIGTGDGKNKIAILDPNATEPDPIIPATNVMNEVLTILGVTQDPGAPPGAVREWCINSAAVDPFTKSVLANSEDGKLYRWDLTTNSFSQAITLSSGIAEAYTPTVIGPDGTAYAINDAILFAIGK